MQWTSEHWVVSLQRRQHCLCVAACRAIFETRLLHGFMSRAALQELLKQAHMRKLRLIMPDEMIHVWLALPGSILLS